MASEQDFARLYGEPCGLFASLMENPTVRHGRAKSGAFFGDRRALDGGTRRPTVEALCTYGGPSCAFANHQSSGIRESHRRLHKGKPVCAEPYGIQYGLARSRTENPQVMGQAGNTHGSCGCSPPLPDEPQKSCNPVGERRAGGYDWTVERLSGDCGDCMETVRRSHGDCGEIVRDAANPRGGH